MNDSLNLFNDPEVLYGRYIPVIAIAFLFLPFNSICI